MLEHQLNIRNKVLFKMSEKSTLETLDKPQKSCNCLQIEKESVRMKNTF